MKKPNLIRITNLKSKQKQQIKNMKAYLSSLVTTKWIKTRKEGKEKRKKKRQKLIWVIWPNQVWMHLVVRRRTSGGEWMISTGLCNGDLSLSAIPVGRFLFFYFIFIFFFWNKKGRGGEKTENVCCGGIVFNDNNYVNFFKGN